MNLGKTKHKFAGLPSDIEKGLYLVQEDIEHIKILLSGGKPAAAHTLCMGVERWVSVCGFKPCEIDSEVIGLYDKLVWGYARTVGDDGERIMRAVFDIYIDLRVAVQMWGFEKAMRDFPIETHEEVKKRRLTYAERFKEYRGQNPNPGTKQPVYENRKTAA